MVRESEERKCSQRARALLNVGLHGDGAVAGGAQVPLSPVSPGLAGAGLSHVPGLAGARTGRLPARPVGRAADMGLSFVFVKKHVFGVYLGKTNNLY